MPDTPDIAAQWKAFTPDQRTAALGRMTPEQKQKLATSLGYKGQPASTPANVLKPQDRTIGNYASEITRGVGRGIVNDVKGLAQTVAHPIQTGTDLLQQANESGAAARKEFDENAAAPMGQRLAATALRGLETAPLIGGMVQEAEKGGSQLASPEAAGAAAEGISSIAAPELAGKGVGAIIRKAPDAMRAVTGTGTKPAQELGAKTAEANKAGEAKAASAKAVEDERDLHTKRVQESSEELRGRIETARNNALKEGNTKYNAVNEKLNPIGADMGDVVTGYLDASDRIKGTEKEPPVLKSIGERIEKGDELTYEDLQGYYSEMNKELSKGTLPGDEYAALDKMHETVGNEMQRIADSQGAGEQLTEARTYWRRMKQTFGKPTSARDAASKTLSSLSPEFAKQDALNNRVRLLSHYDPEIGRAAGEVTESRGKLKSLPKAKPTDFTPQKVNAEDIQGAKAESLQKRADQIRRRGAAIVTTLGAYRALSDAFHGNFGAIPSLLGEAGVGVAATHGFAKLLERPAIVNYLTKATAKDVAAIPPELRGDLKGIVDQAQKKGVKVSPDLVKAAKSGGVAAALTGNKPRFDVETGTQ